jgi:hypothetical protein
MSLLLLLVRCPIEASQDPHMDFSHSLPGTRMAMDREKQRHGAAVPISKTAHPPPVRVSLGERERTSPKSNGRLLDLTSLRARHFVRPSTAKKRSLFRRTNPNAFSCGSCRRRITTRSPVVGRRACLSLFLSILDRRIIDTTNHRRSTLPSYFYKTLSHSLVEPSLAASL